MTKPIAVLISDIHYNLQTLPLADAAMRQAITKANDLNIPLIVAGDLHDTKANMRAECVNAMIKTFSMLTEKAYILVGNHDKINEKSEENSLGFLNQYYTHDDLGTEAVQQRDVIEGPWFYNELGAINGNSVHLVPYHSDIDKLKKYLKKIDKGSMVIMHQGLSGTNSGEYIQDKTAIAPVDVAGLRIISGHYHTRQSIDLPNGGKWDYIGSPYTLNFAEANDPEKGFQILYEDGSLEFVPTNLRKHVVIEITENGYKMTDTQVHSTDLVYVKAIGSKEWLSKLTKRHVADKFAISSFKLDLIPIDTIKVNTTKNLTLPQQLDETIDKLQVTADRKQVLKSLWKEL